MANDNSKRDRRSNRLKAIQHSLETDRGYQDRFRRAEVKRRDKRARYAPRLDEIILDTEVTGLRSEMIYNPGELAWQRDLEQFNKAVHGLDISDPRSRGNILKRARQLSFYKYFEEIGAAQVVMMGGGPRSRLSTQARAMEGAQHLNTGAMGPFRMPLGQGYTHWGFRGTDSRALYDGMGGKVRISQFSLDQGIIRRSTQGLEEHGEAPNFGKLLRQHGRDRALDIFSGELAKGKVAAEVDTTMAFVASLSQKFNEQRRVKLMGWNVWFDVMDMQAFAVRHSEKLLEHGLDPFLLANKYQTGDLVVDATEEFFFDVLRSKGQLDPKFGKRFLRHGRFAPELFGEAGEIIPGAPIDLEKDFQRRRNQLMNRPGGGQSFLRGKAGWKLELVENVFLRYMHLSSDELGIPEQAARFAKAHDAMFDTAMAYQLGKRFQKANRLMQTYQRAMRYSPRHKPEGFKLGKLTSPQIEVLSMARAGFLGQEFEGRGMGNLAFTKWLLGDDVRHGTAAKRNQALWEAYGMSTQKAVDESIRIGRIQRENMASMGTPWARQSFEPTLRNANMLTAAVTRWKGTSYWQPWSKTGKAAVIAGGIGALAHMAWTSMGTRDISGPEANLPPNYIKGQQGQKQIEVPWASPYQGPGQDTEHANLMMAGALGLGLAGFHVLPRVVPERFRKNLYLAARAFEDATPFRVGRIFGMTGKVSSYLTPPDLNVPINMLLGPTDRLTQIGQIYAKGLSVGDAEFAGFLANMSTKKHDSLRFKRSRGPWMKVALGELGEREVRMFEATSRIGQSFVLYGADPGDVTPRMRPETVRRRVGELLSKRTDPQMLGGGLTRGLKAVGRGLYNRSSLFRGYMDRFAAIPKWEINPIKFLQRRGIEQDFWVPAFSRNVKGFSRMASGYAFDAYRSVWHLLRGQTAMFGWDIGQTTSLKGLFGKSMKVAGAVAATGYMFNFVNESLGGALTAPLWNMYERARLTKARISDTLGLTDLRKQHPNVYGWSAAAYFGLPLITLGTASFLRRAAVAVPRDIKVTNQRLSGGRPLMWDKGAFNAAREQPFNRAYQRMNVGIRRLFSKKVPRPGGGVMRKTPGWVKGAVGAYYGLGALLFSPILLGERYSEQEWADIFAGEKLVPIKRGRFWEFGSTPYEGNRTAYFRMHASARRKLDPREEVEGAGTASPLRAMFDPYWRERESYYTRPYPITSAPFEEIPFVGPLLARTIGRFFKPPKLMHTEAWQAGDHYNLYGKDVEPNIGLGGLAPQAPRDPLGWRAQLREIGYRGTEYMGLRGFLVQSMVMDPVFGGESAYRHSTVMAPSRLRSFTDTFYESELGGMLGTNELFRRFFPRPERTEVNPIPNQMPRWMPGDDYFVNFREGDPYAKVPFGEERLPGAGFAARYPELEGVAPSDYPAWARFQILSDVAPWSREQKIFRAVAYREAANDPQMLARLEAIDAQVDEIHMRKNFKHYEFSRNRETVSGTVDFVGPGGEFTMREYPRHTFRLEGVDMGLNASANQIRSLNRMTKEKAVETAYTQRFDAQQKMIDLMVGNTINMSVGVGALNNPNVAGIASAGGLNVNRYMTEQGYGQATGGPATAGFLGRIYGSALETVGHLPQKVPGPFFLHTKFMNQADPIEEYRRSQLYGTEARFWDKPFTNFIRPYYYNTVAKLTPGDFVPEHVQERREVDQLFDRLTFMKAMRNGNIQRANRTAAGMNPYGAESMVLSAMPYREKPYMQAFMQETDPERRSTILGMVSQDMQRALVGQWTKQYAQVTGQSTPNVSSRVRMNDAMLRAEREIRKSGHNIPGDDWIGYHPGVDMEDVKAVYLQQQGHDHHDYNIWEDRMMTMHRKPYLRGSHEFLVSRPMAIPPAILSRAVDRRTRDSIHLSEGLSTSMVARFNLQNTVNRRDEEFAAYERFRDDF